MASHEASVSQLFDEKSSGWARKYDADGALRHRLERFAAVVGARVSPGDPLLDFGCGTGELAAHLADAGFRVRGVDIADGMIEKARARFGDRVELTRLAPDWSRLPFDDASFAGAVASSVLEYVPDLDKVLRELARVVRPGGVFVLTVPDERNRVRRAEAVVRAATGALPDALRARAPGRLKGYLRYLDLSRNRLPIPVWAALFALAGFTLDGETPAPEGPLVLLAFRRAGRANP